MVNWKRMLQKFRLKDSIDIVDQVRKEESKIKKWVTELNCLSTVAHISLHTSVEKEDTDSFVDTLMMQ